jgi:hypothetical protein
MPTSNGTIKYVSWDTCSLQSRRNNLPKTSLRVRRILSKETCERKILCLSEVSAVSILLPIACWKQNLVTFCWWRGDLRHCPFMTKPQRYFRHIIISNLSGRGHCGRGVTKCSAAVAFLLLMLSATAWECDALLLKQKPVPQQWQTMPTIRREVAIICHRVSAAPTHVGPVINLSKKKQNS